MPTSSSSTTPSSVTSTTTSQCLVDIRFYLHVFWQGKNVIHALPEAEIINSFIIPYEEEAAAFPLWMSESCDGQFQDDQGDISLVREDVQGTTVDTIDATTTQVVMAPTTRNTGRVHVQPNSSQPHQAAMDDVAVVQPLNEPEIGIEETAGSRKKCNRVRGPTFMCKVWGQQEDERVKVSFNDKGQPISNNSILSHFLGTIARNGKYAPLHYKSWSKMPRVYKDDMFALVLVSLIIIASFIWKHMVRDVFVCEMPSPTL
ncbi:hypothetical protein RHGRI_012265 [Rhododendron griersonianum]|uniref:Transposase n=1 Tax=Rhododendron griersonianum TaxID=479676 RepID=A0AAV6KR62_9ERIC|nr:hypothetical protein RHGRI_012265 [Rhododendron griersonianum]